MPLLLKSLGLDGCLGRQRHRRAVGTQRRVRLGRQRVRELEDRALLTAVAALAPAYQRGGAPHPKLSQPIHLKPIPLEVPGLGGASHRARPAAARRATRRAVFHAVRLEHGSACESRCESNQVATCLTAHRSGEQYTVGLGAGDRRRHKEGEEQLARERAAAVTALQSVRRRLGRRGGEARKAIGRPAAAKLKKLAEQSQAARRGGRGREERLQHRLALGIQRRAPRREHLHHLHVLAHSRCGDLAIHLRTILCRERLVRVHRVDEELEPVLALFDDARELRAQSRLQPRAAARQHTKVSAAQALAQRACLERAAHAHLGGAKGDGMRGRKHEAALLVPPP